MISSSRMSLERDGPIAALTLLRPDRGNAIDLAFGAELLAAAIEMAETLARRIAEGPRQALAMTKRLLSSSLAGLENHLAKESAAIALQGTSPEAEEGIQAFLAKRRPRFTSGGSAADR